MTIQSSEENGSRMASVITVICCFSNMIPSCLRIEHLEIDLIAVMLSMLVMMPDLPREQCKDWNVVSALIPKTSKQAVASNLFGFCTYLARNRNIIKPEWVYVIPLIHFLREQSVPFGNPQLDPEKIKWTDQHFDLGYVKSRTYSSSAR